MENRNLPTLARVVDELSKFPGVGRKTALRLAYHLLQVEESSVRSLTSALQDLKEKVGFCSRCHALTEQDPCPLCSDPAREQGVLCIVAKQQDLMALSRTSVYRGQYHVLRGVLSPLNGVGPEDLTIDSLLKRVAEQRFDEAILATGFDVEGEATALYLQRLLHGKVGKITRLAHGIPIGGDLEYVDDATMNQAVIARREITD